MFENIIEAYVDYERNLAAIKKLSDLACDLCVELYPEKIIYNGPATIVFWKDGTKTVVKAMNGVDANPYHGFTAALAKKIYGSSSKVNKIVDKYAPEDRTSTEPIRKEDILS